MVIDPQGKMFEERRKKDRRRGIDRRKVNENVLEDKRKSDRRQLKDRRDPKNAYKP